ncbi:MAG: LysR family transcriptional regulator [Rhodobiaceae bacterium]|nr:LysR family transcriptional regulator [Rhodobiaceae bacterium]
MNSNSDPIRTPFFNWNDLKYFLVVCETGSFTSAARHFGVSPNLIRRKVEALESELSAVLFTRSRRGVDITPDGRKVFSIAREIRQQVGFLDQFAIRKASAAEGIIRLATTDGIGTFWIAPRLTEFLNDFPRIRVDLRSEMGVKDLSRLECDVAVQLEEPRDADLMVRKIGTLHLIPFATESYIREKGCPRTYRDLENHRLINLIADQIPSHILAERTQFDPEVKFARVITQTSSAQVTAIASGAGVGLLPSYASALSNNLVPITSEIYFARPIWLAYHPDVAQLGRVKSMINWLIQSFDPIKYPWFRNEYVPPEVFRRDLLSKPVFQEAIGWRSPEPSG